MQRKEKHSTSVQQIIKHNTGNGLKISKSHPIVLGGDFNASLHREPPNNIDKMPRDFCAEAGLTTPCN